MLDIGGTNGRTLTARAFLPGRKPVGLDQPAAPLPIAADFRSYALRRNPALAYDAASGEMIRGSDRTPVIIIEYSIAVSRDARRCWRRRNLEETMSLRDHRIWLALLFALGYVGLVVVATYIVLGEFLL